MGSGKPQGIVMAKKYVSALSAKADCASACAALADASRRRLFHARADRKTSFSQSPKSTTGSG
eukprot:938509-Pyramimonas_sp.AAC.1